MRIREDVERGTSKSTGRSAVEGVMADRRISKRLKGKVMSTCVPPACLYGTDTLNWHWANFNNKGYKCAKTTGYENCKSNDGRPANNGGGEETRMQRSLTERLARSRL